MTTGGIVAETYEQNLKCYECRTPGTATLWRSVDAAEDPAARRSILDGRVNLYVCPKCGSTASLLSEMLYRDRERGFAIQVRRTQEATELDAPIPDGSGHRLRIVSTPHRLSEKVHILEEGLDDLALEGLKFVSERDILGDVEPKSDWLLYGGENWVKGKKVLEFLSAIDFKTGYALSCDDGYCKIKEKVAPHLPELVPVGEWCRVDRAFAMDVFGRILPAREAGGRP
jgi:hypothetical protein